MLTAADRKLMEEVTGLHEIPQGAHNIRINGRDTQRVTTESIDIADRDDKPGIRVTVRPGTKNETVLSPSF